MREINNSSDIFLTYFKLTFKIQNIFSNGYNFRQWGFLKTVRSVVDRKKHNFFILLATANLILNDKISYWHLIRMGCKVVNLYF